MTFRSDWSVFSVFAGLFSQPEGILSDVLGCSEECAPTGQAACKAYSLRVEHTCRPKLNWSLSHTGRPRSRPKLNARTSWISIQALLSSVTYPPITLKSFKSVILLKLTKLGLVDVIQCFIKAIFIFYEGFFVSFQTRWHKLDKAFTKKLKN